MKPKPIYERLRAFLLCFALLAGMLPVTAFAATNVQYIDADGTTNTCANATDVTSSTTSWSTGWYVVNSEVTISTRITVNGVVNLILGDNATLNANAGITVAQGNSLTIYAQENGTGKLIATAQSSSGNTGSNAGIGGTGSGGIGGAVTIYGGTVTATGGTAEYGGSGAGIGGAGGEGGEGGIGAIGSNGGAGVTVTIYGGTVTATGGAGQAGGGAGIGGGGGGGGVNSDNSDPQCATGGAGGAGGNVTIYGGTVTATSKTIRHSGSGAGIGGGGGSSGKTAGGKGGDCAPVAITGGLVTAKSGDTGIGGSGAGIGGGGGGSNFGLSAIADSGNPGTFSTQGGNAVIFASSGNGFHSGAAIGASETAVWSGVIFQGKAGTVYGDQTIEEDFTLEQGYTLTVPQNTTLTIPKGVTLTNRGTINGPGKLTGSGTVTNSGSISVSVNDFAVSVALSITSGGSTVTSVTYGSTVTLTATVTKNSGNVTDGTVTFYRGAATGIPLNSTPANVTDGTAKYELALKGDDWKPGDTAYTITAVYTPASGSNLLSGSGQGTLTVSKADQTTPTVSGSYTIDYPNETISAETGYELAYNSTAAEGQATLTLFPGSQEGTVYVRLAETAIHNASDWAAVSIPARPAAPDVQGVNETVAGRNDGRITGLTAGVDYEISDDSGQSWKNAELTGTEIIDLAPGSYQVRAKSTDTSFTGEAASVTISTGAEPTYTLNVAAPTFDSVYTGYAQPEAKAITISSAGNSAAAISGVTVDNANFVIGGSGSTVPAGGRISTWTIQPAAGLSVGTYTATITVAYNDGAAATAQVSFTVIRRPSSGGGSGGTTPSNPTYTPGVTKPENGAVTIDPEKPKAGDTVTITAMPEERYKVDSVTVTDEDGSPVDVTAQEDGSYTFTQPEGDVTITVTFDVDMPFTDVPEGAWYIEGAKYVYGNFIMSGTSGTTFSPSTPVSRGMIMQILYNMVGQPDVEGGSNFTDVDEDYWSADAIAWAVANGVAGGFGDGTFRPDEGLTREQMAVVLRNFAYQMGWDISASGDLSRFTDIPEDSWARDALAWAFAEGLLTGTSGTTMAPTGEASRAQIAVIMMRFCQRYIDNVE